jgi:hypothetical protein
VYYLARKSTGSYKESLRDLDIEYFAQARKQACETLMKANGTSTQWVLNNERQRRIKNRILRSNLSSDRLKWSDNIYQESVVGRAYN